MKKSNPRNPPLFASRSFGVEQVNQPIVFEMATEITLRDLFAAFSLAGYRAMEADPQIETVRTPKSAADAAYQDADAMLERRKLSSS